MEFHNTRAFQSSVWYVLVVLVYATIVAMFMWRVRMKDVESRKWITRRTLGVWDRGKIYYRLERRVGSGVGVLVVVPVKTKQRMR